MKSTIIHKGIQKNENGKRRVLLPTRLPEQCAGSGQGGRLGGGREQLLPLRPALSRQAQRDGHQHGDTSQHHDGHQHTDTALHHDWQGT